LTSFVALLFLLNGLADLKVISSDPRAFAEKALCGLACIIGIYLSSNSPIIILGFYTLTVVLFCGSYALMQLIIIYRTRSFRGFLWLLSAGVFGLVGLMGLDAFYCTLCTDLGGWATEGLWYYLSDCRCTALHAVAWLRCKHACKFRAHSYYCHDCYARLHRQKFEYQSFSQHVLHLQVRYCRKNRASAASA